MHDGQSSGTSVIMVLLCIVMSFDELMSHEVYVLHQEGKCHIIER